MMKKNILFVMPSLTAGGGEKSLVNLLYQIDYTKYNVDLFLFHRTGLFLHALPSQVNLLELPGAYRTFTRGLKDSIQEYVGKGQWRLSFSRLMFTIMNRVSENAATSEQYSWRFQSAAVEPLAKEYDAAIGYLEKSSIYFVVDKVKARRKIGWIHTNYANSGMNRDFDSPYFAKLDHLVTVSEECANSLKRSFRQLESRVKVIYNIVSPSMIRELAVSSADERLPYDARYTNIITVARLSTEKGIDLAVGACKQLIDQGHMVRWYVLGDGAERAELERQIGRNGLQSHFCLLGLKKNPYPYIKHADLYVQPSRYEGKSIALDEAKILQKPIVVTGFETAKDQITDGVNGLIVPMNEAGLAGGIASLIGSAALRDGLIRELKKEKLGTEQEVQKLYDIMN